MVPHPPQNTHPAASLRDREGPEASCEQLRILLLLEAGGGGLQVAGEKSFLPCLLASERTTGASVGWPGNPSTT